MSYKISLANAFTYEKLGKFLEIKGVLLAPGTYTDKTGKTVYYPEDVIERSLSSFVGVPLVYPHTSGEEDVLKVVGFTTQTWKEGANGLYKGYIYDPEVIDLVKREILTSSSIEAELHTEYDPSLNVEKATQIVGEAIALTDRPACRPCIIHSHQEVTSVHLSPAERVSRVRKSAGKQTERRIALSEENVEEQLEVEPEVPEELEEKPKSAEDILGQIKQLLQEYPMPRTKAWGDMTDAEKYRSCVIFFKRKGYPYPVPASQETELAKAPTMKAYAYAMKAAGLDEATITKVLTILKQKYPYPYPKAAAEEDIEEIVAELFPKESEELEAIKKENELLKKELEEIEKKEVESLTQEIKSIDKEFDEKSFLEGVDCLKTQKVMLQRYKANLERLKPSVTLTGVSEKQDEKKRLDKVSMQAFGMPFDALMKSIEEVK